MKPKRGPIVIEAEVDETLTPETAAPVPDIVEGRAMQAVTAIAARRPSWLARLFWAGLTALVGMMISVALWDFVTGLLARNTVLGQVALGLVAVLGLALVLILVRELAGFARLAKIDAVRDAVRDAATAGIRSDAVAVSEKLMRLYAGREEVRWARKAIVDQEPDQLEAEDVLALTERELMGPLDKAAVAEIQAASRLVAAGTAIVPLPLMDVLIALTANVRMVRRVAQTYGGRTGTLGSWRLLRAVATHLIATGAVAIGDDLIGSVAGGGALAKVSRRFGEGVINGALTARVGVAAMEVCRPMPFSVMKRPKVTGIIKTALVGLFK